jgi:hypothetical protein
MRARLSDETGQVSAEYIGIIVVLGALIAFLTGAAGDIADVIKEQIIEKIQDIG